MSENEHLQKELNQDMAWLEGSTTPKRELPEYLQAAIGYMQLIIEKVESDETLTPDELELLVQASIYATWAG